jgi:hypothetical protein
VRREGDLGAVPALDAAGKRTSVVAHELAEEPVIFEHDVRVVG